MDSTNRALREKMKKRRAAMEATIMSDTGSYRSDTEDTIQRTVTPTRDMVSSTALLDC